MKCNVRELALLSDHPCDFEGRLNYKKISNGSYRHQAVFKERWFRLINNYLFYFKLSEMGKFDSKNPAGMFVMENSSIQMEHGHSLPFSFSISFIDEPEKRHVLSARAEHSVTQWVARLRECSYEHLRSRLHALQARLYAITGKDPLLLVPRNEGACLWAPSEPFSSAPACGAAGAFSCHLHAPGAAGGSGAFALERSKSDVIAHKNLRDDNTIFYTNDKLKNTTFYTDHDSEKKDPKKFGLERSKTSGLLPASALHASNSIFEDRAQFSRVAPSPPARKKLSPGGRRADRRAGAAGLLGSHTSGILDTAPVKPQRRVSPKCLDLGANSSENITSSGDLIQF